MQDSLRLDVMTVFAAVAESGTFTAAAARLSVTKAAVSNQVRELEERLGATLFARTTRHVRLTPVGQALYDEAAPALAALRSALASAGDSSKASSGSLRITATVDHAALVVAPVLAQFAVRYPEVSVDLVTCDDLVDLVTDGIDIAFRLGELRDSSLRATRLGSFEQHVFASPGYLERAGEPQHPDDLVSHHWISHTRLRAPLTWDFVGGDGTHAAVRLRARLQVDSSSSLRALIERDAGISVLSDRSVADAVSAGRLVRILADWRLPSGGEFAVLPPGKHIHPLTAAFLAMYREYAGPG